MRALSSALSVSLALCLVLAACGGDKFITGDGAAGDGAAGDGAADDGSGAGDGGDAGKLRTITCKGPRDCLTLTEACCLQLNQVDDMCISKPAMAGVECPGLTNTLLVMCDDTTDCLGANICCATKQGNAFSSACVQPTTCGGGDRLMLCDPAHNQCTAPLTCKPHPLVPRYYACQ